MINQISKDKMRRMFSVHFTLILGSIFNLNSVFFKKKDIIKFKKYL